MIKCEQRLRLRFIKEVSGIELEGCGKQAGGEMSFH
jgi:hypothetical protein